MGIRVQPGSPGCCLLSLLLLPFHIVMIPFRIVLGPSRRQQVYPRRGRYM